MIIESRYIEILYLNCHIGFVTHSNCQVNKKAEIIDSCYPKLSTFPLRQLTAMYNYTVYVTTYPSYLKWTVSRDFLPRFFQQHHPTIIGIK